MSENYIHVCCFFNKVKNLPRSVIAHPAAITITPKYGFDEARLHTVIAFGFRDDIEYANAYPGGFKRGSEVSRLINLNTDVSDPDATSKVLNAVSDFYGGSEYDPKVFRKQLLRFFAGEAPQLMASVTMDAVRGCTVFRNESDDHLWFCTDWKGW